MYNFNPDSLDVMTQYFTNFKSKVVLFYQNPELGGVNRWILVFLTREWKRWCLNGDRGGDLIEIENEASRSSLTNSI